MDNGLNSVSTILDGLWAAVTVGGPVLWVIALLSVAAVAAILWKIMHLAGLGAWSRTRRIDRAINAWSDGHPEEALQSVSRMKGLRARMAATAMAARMDSALDEDGARDETARTARSLIASSASGIRLLELISTVAPLLGLLGTVLGMIAAFQALQIAGTRADPSDLAGGIWEALLTTAAGMAVAIPTAMAVTWFESVVETIRLDLEDIATRIFVRPAVLRVPEAELEAAQ